MTGGVVAVLGPAGLNFGSGMTGGLAYVLRTEAEHILNTEFVQPHELEHAEERYLRALLEKHVALTDSPRAFRLLALPALPLLRIEPIHFQGTLEGAWKAAGLRVGELVTAPAGNYFGAESSAAPQYA